MKCIVATCFFVSLAATATCAHAALTESEQKRVDRLKRYIDRGAQLYKQEQFAKSTEELARAHKLVNLLEIDADEELREAIKPSLKRLERAGELLLKRGHSLPKVNAVSDSSQPTTEVSFTKQIAPILVARCSNCHIREAKGELSMSTYADLITGSENGPVISSTSDDSKLIVTIVSGDMPPRGDRVPTEEIELLKRWVEQGAKIDGGEANRTAPISSFVSRVERGQSRNREVVVPRTGRPSRPQRPPFDS